VCCRPGPFGLQPLETRARAIFRAGSHRVRVIEEGEPQGRIGDPLPHLQKELGLRPSALSGAGCCGTRSLEPAADKPRDVLPAHRDNPVTSDCRRLVRSSCAPARCSAWHSLPVATLCRCVSVRFACAQVLPPCRGREATFQFPQRGYSDSLPAHYRRAVRRQCPATSPRWRNAALSALLST